MIFRIAQLHHGPREVYGNLAERFRSPRNSLAMTLALSGARIGFALLALLFLLFLLFLQDRRRVVGMRDSP
jgi:hypothetical protein